MGAVSELHVLKYWPKGEAEDLTMASFLDRLVTTPQQLRWLVNTLVDQVGTYRAANGQAPALIGGGVWLSLARRPA